ncbi:hypothetical protein OG689_11895 [Kitasatospora sp. NBC_00240]|uniref:hypothetical protein n=1 Tax=Kitasatospora sp. NBC_00240 TaxID=2903567 RepID=UPI00224D0845|nr:hypothetical protein [Kitasatospora sp. NBC_00240]MCX5209985.1 hypothetical protein [Kitasatospora sp. NBC_00240]
MSQKVRFITIVALGFSVLTGTAATVTLAGPSQAHATVLTADGATGGTPATPVNQPAAATATPSPLPTGPQDTWGWG